MRPFPWLPAALAGAVCVALGCGSGSDLDRPEANQAPVTRPCNVIGDVCILPYPSSVFSVTDPATPVVCVLGRNPSVEWCLDRDESI